VIDPYAHLRAALVEADRSFAATGSGLDALGWVRLAVEAGLPLPEGLRNWVCESIERYLNDQKAGTLGGAFGLGEDQREGEGLRKDPRLIARRGHGPKWAALAEMFVLQLAGATVRQAAELVASLRAFAAETLEQAYRRSGYGVKVKRSLGAFGRISEVRVLLDQYPDRCRQHPDLAEHKAAILSMYAKRRQ